MEISYFKNIKFLTVLFIGFILGNVGGYYILLAVEKKNLLLSKNFYEQTVMGPLTIKSAPMLIRGTIESVENNKNFLILKFADPFESNAYKKIKIYFDQNTIFKNIFTNYVNITSGVFRTGLIKDLQNGDRVTVRYTKRNQEFYALLISPIWHNKKL